MIELRLVVDGDKHEISVVGDPTLTELLTLLGALEKVKHDIYTQPGLEVFK